MGQQTALAAAANSSVPSACLPLMLTPYAPSSLLRASQINRLPLLHTHTSPPITHPLPAAIVAAPSGCAINLGSNYVPRYRRCIRADVSQGAGRQLQLATSLAVLNNKLVLSGALLLPSHACTLGFAGWVGFGLPKDQGSPNKMVGAKVLFIQPAPSAPSGERRTACQCEETEEHGFLARNGHSHHQLVSADIPSDFPQVPAHEGCC